MAVGGLPKIHASLNIHMLLKKIRAIKKKEKKTELGAILLYENDLRFKQKILWWELLQIWTE